MKEYLFSRDTSGRALITVKNGAALYPLRHVIVYDPKGMDYGYYGFGTADTAISILFDLVGVKVDTEILRPFMREFIATIDADEGGTIPGDEIIDWIKTNAPELLEKGER